MVYEVGLDGKVVRLKDIQGPQKKKREQHQAPSDTQAAEGKLVAPSTLTSAETSATSPEQDQPRDASHSVKSESYSLQPR